MILRLIGLSTVIFMAGWLGLKTTVPPGYASPLWPPAGIALATLMLWGKRFWPAIFIGSLANEFLAGYQANAALTPVTLISFCVISTGFTLQALAGYWLSARFLGAGVPRLDNAQQAIVFFLLTGPLACLLGASVGVSCITMAGLLPTSQVAQAWLNWWIGDTLGVLIISPLVFCGFAKPRELWALRRIQLAIPLLVTIMALALIFIQVYQTEKFRIQTLFDNHADKIDRLLREYAHNVIDSTLSIRDLYRSSQHISRDDFATFTRALLARHPEIQALEWLPRVTPQALARFEASIRSEGFPDFKVVERASDGSLRAVDRRDEYFPVTFIEPMQGNERAFGFDSASNLISRQSKGFASQYDTPSLSSAITLIQRPDISAGLLLSIPVYQDRERDGERRLQGFVSAAILPEKMVRAALQGLDTQAFAIKVEDIGPDSQVTELFSQTMSGQLNSSYGLQPWQRTFKICERTWRIQITPDNTFLAINGSILPWMTLSGGLFFTSLLCILLLSTTGRRAYVEALVEKRTTELKAAETQLRTVIESQPDCIELLAHDGTILQINQAGLKLLGATTLQELQNWRSSEQVLPQYRATFTQMMQQVFAGESVDAEFEMYTLEGRRIWLECYGVPVRDAANTINAMLSVTRDITERKQADERKKLAARVFGEAHEGIVITNADGIIIDVNPTFCDITGYARDEVIGKSPRILQSGKHPREFYQTMWHALNEYRHWRGEVWNRKKNGELYAELLTISVLCDDDGQVLYYLGLFSDITESKQQQQMLELLAHFDPLTRIPNRTLFADRMLQAIAASKREQTLLAICFLDLDGFKPVNDQWGHDAGDLVLVEVAERIKQNLRESDTVSRHGGDEFAVLLRDVHTLEECEATVQRIHQAIAQPYSVLGHEVKIGVSSGITIYPLDDADPDTLLRHADHAMYQAKLCGKNRYCFFDASRDQQEIDRHNSIVEISKAFHEQQFCLYFQPKVNLKTGRVVGVEALIRWLHPQRGLVPPVEFIPVIAGSELEIEMGNWVIEQAWQQLGVWHASGFPLDVSVNISSYHLLQSDFLAHLEKTLASLPHLASSFLQLEILESTALDDLTAVHKIIRACRDGLGVSAALDDFGTGYSSLTHLRHLPVNSVKIDQSFVRDMLDDWDDFAIVESVIGLSESFYLDVVAEGVEHHDQGTVLLLMGCELAQGYAIAKPMPADEIDSWIRRYRHNPEWLFYANQNPGVEENLITILQIEIRHWVQRIQAYLTEAHEQSIWPMAYSKKSHFSYWIKRSLHHTPHRRAELIELENLHQALIEKSQVLRGLIMDITAGELQQRIMDLIAIQRRLDDELTHYLGKR